jgi:membrane protease YdiL (CAAX protease family)
MPQKQKTKFYSANLVYFIIMVGFVIIRLCSAYDLLGFLGNAQTYVLNAILQIGLMLLLPIFLYSRKIKQSPKQTLQSFGMRKITLTAIAISVAIGVVVFVLNIGVSSFFAFLLSIFGYEKMPTTGTAEPQTIGFLLLSLLFTAVLPAICEEITHRGMLIDAYSKLGYKKAILYSALLFGLTHLNIEQFFYATVVGFLLAFITMATGNIIPAIIIHFMNNAINVFISYGVATSQKFNQIYNSIFDSMTTGNPILVLSTMFFVISLLLFVLGLLIYLLFKKTTVAELTALAEQETKKQLRAELMGEEAEEILPDSVPFQILRGNKTFQVYISTQTLRHPLKQEYFPPLWEKAFLIASFVLSIFVTVATFIWGIL